MNLLEKHEAVHLRDAFEVLFILFSTKVSQLVSDCQFHVAFDDDVDASSEMCKALNVRVELLKSSLDDIAQHMAEEKAVMLRRCTALDKSKSTMEPDSPNSPEAAEPTGKCRSCGMFVTAEGGAHGPTCKVAKKKNLDAKNPEREAPHSPSSGEEGQENEKTGRLDIFEINHLRKM